VSLVRPITGLTEQEVLWELPLCRGLAYLHMALVKEGIETQWVGHDMMEDETIKNAMDYIQRRKTSRLVNSLT
jgi:hypothetical protein